MDILARSFRGPSDLQAMAALVQRFPAENIHVVDLPYRLCSPAFDFPANIRLWTDPKGQLLAWAGLQVPFWTVDYAIHPDSPSLLPRVLSWADERARTLAGTASGHPAWFVTVLAGQTERRRALETAGFASQADVGEDSWSQVLMQHSMQIPTPGGLPPGFHLRPLYGLSEVEAYVQLHQAVFESRNMTVAWRTRTLQRPEYDPDLDLVVVAPSGELAAFWIGWLAANRDGELSGQVEPMGVSQAYRQLGLGQAILAEGLQRLANKGARQIFVQTDNFRNAAFKLYAASGFQVIGDILVYRKEYG